MRFLVVAAALCVGVTLGQYQPTTTPVPILKQINRHNEDGSYSYGFEAADGSYKIESKHPNGEVYGKYGFIDDSGTLREIEYGATSRGGFVPAGTGINVPPPAVQDNRIDNSGPEDDGQYREDPSIYHTDPRYTNGERYDPVPQKYPTIQNHIHLQQRPLSYSPLSSKIAAAYSRPTPAPAPAPLAIQPQFQQPQYRPQYQTQFLQPYSQQPQYYQPQPQPQYSPVSRLSGHPASTVNLQLGSYSVKYRR